MNRVEKIRKRLEDRRLYVVSRETGVSYQSLRDILTGKTREPKLSTIEKLEKYLAR